MKMTDIIALIFVLAGGINWGLIGIFDFNLVDYIFAKMYIDRIIYVLVGLSAIYLMFTCKSCMRHTKRSKSR